MTVLFLSENELDVLHGVFRTLICWDKKKFNKNFPLSLEQDGNGDQFWGNDDLQIIKSIDLKLVHLAIQAFDDKNNQEKYDLEREEKVTRMKKAGAEAPAVV
tara:strand:+ start:1627 stop:1932 length:306 start_codon:yes stop_codon:yes gene_type:complete